VLLISIFSAETVGFEAYFRHHLSRYSLDFGEISANTRPGNHMETRSEVLSCGQDVGRAIHPTIAIVISNRHSAIGVNIILQFEKAN
jgi:hypothetical protein